MARAASGYYRRIALALALDVFVVFLVLPGLFFRVPRAASGSGASSDRPD